uniref:NADH-ubiquinone oxidoreductase chain 1 n=1 Tax=Gonatocerus sp. ZCS-2018 TaxID=2305128 RepID=A0A346PZ48_9HYME|nr:NADH dehydrogenase subunit 1 [Gonatocerus sp. ZCS-2018]
MIKFIYLYYFIHTFLILILNIVMVLISVAFLTLLERKILGYIQLRKGPNKISYMGLFQPFSDAIKLFIKESSLIFKSNMYMYMLSPMMLMILMMMLWTIIPIYSNLYSMNLTMIYLLCIMSLSVYSLMLAGWSSNSIYSLIGSLRSIAQTISYEVSFIFILMNSMILIENFMIYDYYIYQKYMMFLILLLPNSMMMIVSMLAELNRTPFDFAEGESELVSGFNVEYMSGKFAMIFISEYGSIMFMSYLFMLMFMKCEFMYLYFYLIYFLLVFLIIWIRGAYPRFRYDKLMSLTWKFYLPISMYMIIMIILMKMI